MQVKNKKYTIFFVLAVFTVIALTAPAAAVGGSSTVHNLNTGEHFGAIQAAIYDPDTDHGHTILVDSKTYTESVTVNKSVILQGNDTDGGLPVIQEPETSSGFVIYLEADGVEIHDFNLQVETGNGIQVESNDNWIDAVTMDVAGNNYGIYIDERDGNKITGCTVNKSDIGLYLLDAADNEVTDCTFNEGNYAGIYIYGHSNDRSDYNVISDCTISGGVNGIYLYSFSAHNEIRECTISGGFSGIGLNGYSDGQTHDNVITGCTVNDGWYSLSSIYSSYNTISDCTFIGAKTDGIRLGSSHNNIFTRCTVRDTLGQEAVNCGVKADESTGNTFEDCSVTNNVNHGFYFDECDGTTLRGCTVNDNDFGIHFQYSDFIQVKDCTVTGNSNAGIILSDNGNNIVVANNFLKNTQNVDLSQNINPNVDWNTAKTAGTSIVYGPYLGGNFWATPDGDGWSETHADADGDGIIDEPYEFAVQIEGEPITYTDYLPLAYVMTAGFTGTPTSGTATLPVQFADTSIGVPTAWSWDFGDGATSSASNPLHKYTSQGTYTVSLTASNEYASDSETMTGYISVSASGNDGKYSETAAAKATGLSAGDNTTLTLDPSKSAFYTVVVTVNGTVKEILVTARDTGLPGSSIPDPNGTIFQFIEVTLYKTTDDLIEQAEILFTVPLEWLEEEGFDPADIVLYRWHDGEWQPLPTTFVKEEDGKVYFTATSPGFSLFAIAAVEEIAAGEEATTVPTGEPTVQVTEAEETAEPATTATPTPAPTQSPLCWAPVLALGGMLLLLRRR